MSTAVSRTAVALSAEGLDMLGIVTRPGGDAPLQPVGVVVVVGGAQYRVGSHRQFLKLANRLAAAGYAVLRFDFPGMGDSPGEPVQFDETSPCITAAIDTLQRHVPGVRHIVLWGLCDGASAGLLHLHESQDPRVTGLVLLNPWVRSAQSLARTRVKHYYLDRLTQAGFWRKLLAGQVGRSALGDLAGSLRRMRQTNAVNDRFQDRMALAWHAYQGASLLLLSEHDLTAKEFIEHADRDPAWAGWRSHSRLTLHTLPGADHTCSTPSTAQAVEQCTLAWLDATQGLP